MMKYFLALVAAIVIVSAIYGAYLYPQMTPVSQQFGSTPQGSTGSTARQYNAYGVNLAAPGANATSTSIQNTSGNDLYVSGVKIACQGIGTSQTAYSGSGLSSLTVAVGTTSTAAPAARPGPLLNGNTFTIATSSPAFGLASSTMSNFGSATSSIVWGSNTYMTFWTNATNTAVCTFGVDAFTS